MNKIQSRIAFSLVELMTAIVIIGVLSAVAVVNYKEYVLNSKLSEAYVGLENLTKMQLAYFNENKSFYYLVQNPGQYLYGSGFVSQATHSSTGWDVFGYLYKPGEKIMFSFGAIPGRTSSSGAQVQVSQTSATSNALFATNWQLWAYQNKSPAVSNPCSSLTAGDFISITGKRNYDWLVVDANRDFTISNENSKCTRLIKTIDTNTAGELQVGPVITLDLGE
jgi:prepilin-type N-terminal cleavage/methylation domain-containing protein